TVLDVGCGGGATSLPLADAAGRVIGVDRADDMLEAFRSALETRTSVETVRGGWPEAAANVPHAHVVVCGHVLYNVQDLAPFTRALDGSGDRVLVELTDHHPLRWMNDLWRRFHGLEFPEGPTADLARQALEELGFEVHRDRRDASRGHGGFPTREEAVAIVRRRLCLPADRDGEVAEALGDRLREDDGHWSAGPPSQEVFTLWWDPRR
ncbi:MAG TPA: methyltransferase domain-containing protein, partial [Actinomycetota bacterium]